MASSPWPGRWPRRSPPGVTSWSRRARARGSRSPISCPPSSGKRVVVATATKALQDQLVAKDLPFLDRHLDRPFTFAYLKGRSNYLCVQRMREEAAANGSMLDLAGDRQVMRLVAWATEQINSSGTGDRAELSFEPSPASWAVGQRLVEGVPGRQPLAGRVTLFRRAGQGGGGHGRRRRGQHPPVSHASGGPRGVLADHDIT